MKRAAIGFLVLAFASVAEAGRWKYCGNGVYQGDTYYWHAYYKCGCWYKDRLCPVVDCPQPGTPGFWEKMAELNVKADELQAEANYVTSRWPGRYRGANVETTGYSTVTQGYAVQGGTTLTTTGPTYNAVDINAIVHEAQRNQELAAVNTSSCNAQVNSIVNSAVEGNTAAARIIAGGQVAAAMIAASTPPTTNTTVFQSRTLATGPAPSSVVSTAPLGNSGDAVALLTHGLLMANCAACHNPNKLSHNLDLTLDPSQLTGVRDAIEKAITTGKMPKDHPMLSEAVRNGILAGIPRATFTAPVPQAEAPPAPPQPTQMPANDPPPTPPQG